MRMLTLCAPLVLLGLAACSGLPNAGPTRSQIFDQAAAPTGAPFSLVEIDARLAALSNASGQESLAPVFSGVGKPPGPVVGIGDSVAVTIWQAATPGLLSAAPSSGSAGTLGGGGNATNSPGQITLPEQVVGTDGGISVPFAGRIRAVGRTSFQIQQSIERALADRLLEPQVLVTVPRSISETATVSGESVSGARTPLSGGGERLLDVIAAAGGVKAPPYETQVWVSRRGQIGLLSMSRLISNPRENIYVWPGDVITVLRKPKTFSVFGATLNNSLLPFNADELSLAQAIARAGGLQDARADPSGVFLFRFEQADAARAMGVTTPAEATSGQVPVLYHLDLNQAGSYFLASRFGMKNDDLIYIAGASTNALQKFFTLISTITGPVISGAVIAR